MDKSETRVERVEYDGKFTVTYRTSDMGPEEFSAFRVTRPMGALIARAPALLAENARLREALELMLNCQPPTGAIFAAARSALSVPK